MRENIKLMTALTLEDQITLKYSEKVYDTDVELDVYDLGLIYEIHLDEAGLWHDCHDLHRYLVTVQKSAGEIVAGLKQIDGIEDVRLR